MGARRAVQLGGRRSRYNGGGGDPTKDVIISKGSEEVPRLRSPGSAKMVRVTNKAGRVFNISIPISKLTHPQKKLISPLNGRWTELDTSYADVGDLDEDTPTPMDELAAQGSTADILRDELRHMCVEYVSMDTNGMVNHPQLSEKHTGPDYEDEDRKTKRRRLWFAIRHRFDDLRTVMWPDVAAQPRRPPTADRRGGNRKQVEVIASALGDECHEAGELALHLYDTLNALAAASVFGITKKAPYEERPSTDFEPLDLQREVRITCQALHRATDGGAAVFGSGEAGAQRLTTMASLCATHRVPFESCFVGVEGTDAAGGAAAKYVLEVMPLGGFAVGGDKATPMGSVRNLPQKLANGLLHVLSNMKTLDVASWTKEPERQLFYLQRLDALLGCCTRAAAGDALGSFDGDDVVTFLQAVVKIRRDNDALFHLATSDSDSDSDSDSGCTAAAGLKHFCKAFQTHVAVVLARCSALLYHKQGNAPLSSIMSEDAYVPMVDLQAHADTQHRDIVVHHKIGASHAQGLRYVQLHARHAALMVGLMQELKACDHAAVSSLPGTSHLQDDLLMHVSNTLGGGKAKLLSMDDLITTLEAVGRQLVRRGGLRHNVWRVNRILSIVDQRVAGLLHEVKDLATLGRLVQAFAACNCVPSCVKRIEPVALRLLSLAANNPDPETLRAAAAVCDGIASMGNPTRRSLHVLLPPMEQQTPVSPALLDRCARVVDVYLQSLPRKQKPRALGAAAPLLIALAHGQYDNIGGFAMKHLDHIVALLAEATTVEAVAPLLSLLLVAHRSGVEAGTDAATLHRLMDHADAAMRHKALATSTGPWPLERASVVVELAAARLYMSDRLPADGVALPSMAVSSADALPWTTHLGLPEVVVLYMALPKHGSDNQADDCATTMLRDALMAAKATLCGPAVSTGDLKGDGDAAAPHAPRRRPTFNVQDLDHRVQMMDAAPRADWPHARWSAMVLLKRASTTAGGLPQVTQTLAAELLGAYMQRVVEALGHTTTDGTVGNSFELNHARREELRSELEADVQECASVLEGCGLLHVAEAQFAVEEGRPSVSGG